MGIEPIPVNKAPAARNFTSEMEGTLERVRKNLQMKLNANKHRLAAPAYKIGQQVWLATENLWLTCASWKLSERWLGPYTIVSLAGPNAVKLKLPRSLQIHSIVNMSQIKPYHGSMEGQNPHQPRPVNMTKDWDNKWEVDHIVDSHLKNKKTWISCSLEGPWQLGSYVGTQVTFRKCVAHFLRFPWFSLLCPMYPFHWSSRFPSALSKPARAIYWSSPALPPFQSPGSWSLEGG